MKSDPGLQHHFFGPELVQILSRICPGIVQLVIENASLLDVNEKRMRNERLSVQPFLIHF